MTNGNGPAGSISIQVKPPTECSVCKAVSKMIDEHQDGWTIIRFDMMGICIFVCPFCHGFTANTNIAETVTWANEQRKQAGQRRVSPVRGPLIVPPGSMPPGSGRN